LLLAVACVTPSILLDHSLECGACATARSDICPKPLKQGSVNRFQLTLDALRTLL